MRWLGLLALCLPSFAGATTGLQWSWPAGESRRYVIKSQTQVSQLFQMRAEDNLDRRILEWRLNLNIDCKPGETGKRSVEVVCDIDDLSLAVVPQKGEAERLDEILEEYDKVLTSAKISMRFNYNGRINDVELLDVKHRGNNQRVREIQQLMRLMLVRPLAGLDLSLPKAGDDNDKPWQSREAILMEFPHLQGTTGGAQMVSQIASTDGDVVVIETSGEGVRGPSVTNSRGDFANLWKMNFFSRTSFDTKHGIMLSREALAEGQISSSSDLATGANVPPYTQALSLEYVGPGKTVEAFGKNEVLVVVPAAAKKE